MRSVIWSALALSTISSALPTLNLRDCTAPTSFTINGFTTFFPAPENDHAPFTNFQFSDSIITTPIRCSLNGSAEAGALTACDNPSVSFSYNGTVSSGGYLSISQLVDECDKPSTAEVFVSTYCYPVAPPIPYGKGTQCQTPTASFSGSFAA